MSLSPVSRSNRPARIGILFCIALEIVIALALTLAGNAEGWWGGVVFGALYAAPLMALFLLLRARRPALATAAGLVAIPLAFAYVALPIANWSGYHSTWEATRAVLATVPAVAGCFLVFAAGVQRLRR